MPIKDKIVTWYIQNIILPRREIIDKPGFLITTFTEKNQTTYLRDLLLPEKLLEEIESRVVSAYGDRGRQALYSAGKKFGYIYCSMSNFPNIKNSTQKELQEFAYLFVRYCEGTFTQKAEHKMDLENKIITFVFDNYIICRHNGLGHVMTEGASAGVWAYVMQDNNLESNQSECQGRGDNRCFVLCAPENIIQEKTQNFFREKELYIQKFDDVFKTMNEIRPTHSSNSLRLLLDTGYFNFSHGVFSHKNMRFFFCDSHLLYFLEQEISKLENGEQILFNACFEYGKFLRETYGERDFQKFIPDFFPALGFGDIIILDPHKPCLASVYYPWSIFSKNSRYIIFRGIMSGFVSSSIDKRVEFINHTIDIKTYLTLTIST